MQNTSFIAIFLTGLLTGGLTCLAVQGGLLASTIAQREEERLKGEAQKGTAAPILWFLLAKLVAYTILGLLLGWFGSLFALSLTVKLVMQFAVVIFMFGTAMALLDVHPFFRYFIIQPPKFLTRLVRKQSKSKDIFAPAILGAFTVFIPCGTTQAMMALAIASGSAIRGAGIMYAFVLGTSPIFFLLGYFATRLGDFWHKKFFRAAAFAIILLSLFNLNNALALTGKPISLTDIGSRAFCAIAYCPSGNQTAVGETNSNITLTIGASGYSPNSFSVPKDSDIKIKLVNQGGSSCVQDFTIPSLGVQKVVPLGSSGEVTFHSPSKPTQIAFMCSMGMYRGTINVN
ncbi:MAG: sulfite exporter TauE/SafE family protein [Candidatus Doudnabacteria bacterium]|nr:sulfite exporter TauE/SafE family protein [Candidatus Doudnabacteria bacterium]